MSEMTRITPEMVQKAIDKTGWKLFVRGQDIPHNSLNFGCAIEILYRSHQDNNCDDLVSFIESQYCLSYNYFWGFVYGFDDHLYLRGDHNHEDYIMGQEDGLICRKHFLEQLP